MRRDCSQQEKTPAESAGVFSVFSVADQVQVMRPAAEEAQVFAVSVWLAAACHEAGGPATAVAVTVTFCEGEKPCADPFPEKYVPELSAA